MVTATGSNTRMAGSPDAAPKGTRARSVALTLPWRRIVQFAIGGGLLTAFIALGNAADAVPKVINAWKTVSAVVSPPTPTPVPPPPVQRAEIAEVAILEPRVTQRHYLEQNNPAGLSTADPAGLDRVGNTYAYKVAVRGGVGARFAVKGTTFDTRTEAEDADPNLVNVLLRTITPVPDEAEQRDRVWMPIPGRTGMFYVRLELFLIRNEQATDLEWLGKGDSAVFRGR